jgi:hypothetical protein
MKLSDITIVATAGEAVVLGTENINSAIAIKALTTNSGLMYIGNDGTDDVDSTTGFHLDTGDTIILDNIGDLEYIYIDAQYDGEGVSWLRLN